MFHVLAILILRIKMQYFLFFLFVAESLSLFAGLYKDEDNESIVAVVNPMRTEVSVFYSPPTFLTEESKIYERY